MFPSFVFGTCRTKSAARINAPGELGAGNSRAGTAAAAPPFNLAICGQGFDLCYTLLQYNTALIM